MRLLFIGSLVSIASAACAAPTFIATHLTVENLVNHLAIDIAQPRFSWILDASERNGYQSAYEIEVSVGEEFTPADHRYWQSGKVNSNENVLVEYTGPALKSFTRYYWRVKVYSLTGVTSGWSEVNYFETAALSGADWSAKWINDGREQFKRDEDFYQRDPMPLFRRKIKTAKKIRSARVYMSGLGYSELYINDRKVGDHLLDPGYTAHSKQVLYVTYDVTAKLRKGANVIGVMTGNGWYNPLPMTMFGKYNLRDFQQTGRPCLKLELRIIYTDGSSETVVTDEQWQTTTGPVVRNSVYLGEEYDARLEKKFSDDNGWQPARLTKGPSGELSSQLIPAVRITKKLKPLSVTRTGDDTFIVDFGQNFAGVAGLRVKGRAGQAVTLRYAEILHPDGSINWMTTTAGHIKEMWHMSGGPGAPLTAWQQDRYILKGNGTEEWHPRFTFHGFRYVEITGWPGTPTLEDIDGLRMNSDVQQQGTFTCSNELFNRVHEATQWTFLSNLFSVQSDCPAREKFGYGADMVVTAGAYCYNYDMSHFYRKAVNDFANDQQPDGGITEIAPYPGIHVKGLGGESGPVGWQLAFAFLQKKVYDQYADKRIIEDYYPAFKKQLDFLEEKSDNHLFYWDIGDHEALDPKADAFSATCFYLHHAELATEFAGILKCTEDSLYYAKLAGTIRAAIIKNFNVPGTGRFGNTTQASQLFALYYGLAPDNDKVAEVLMEELRRWNWHLSTGIFSTYMFFDVLNRMDMDDVCYKIASQTGYPGWEYMLRNDATTLWETWEKPASASYNHPMFGSIDEWFYKSVAGITSLTPGFKTFRIKPVTDTLVSAEATYLSPYGKIGSKWEQGAERFRLYVSVPVNSTAEVWLPAKTTGDVTEAGKPLTGFQNRFQDKYLILTVGSGNYNFSCRKVD